jgi:hypothetical protein
MFNEQNTVENYVIADLTGFIVTRVDSDAVNQSHAG